MYEKFSELLQKYDISAYKVSKDTGIVQATLSAWKNGDSTRLFTRLPQNIARYSGTYSDLNLK